MTEGLTPAQGQVAASQLCIGDVGFTSHRLLSNNEPLGLATTIHNGALTGHLKTKWVAHARGLP